jgi:hypothetical protein
MCRWKKDNKQVLKSQKPEVADKIITIPEPHPPSEEIFLIRDTKRVTSMLYEIPDWLKNNERIK